MEPQSLEEHEQFERMCCGKERYPSESSAWAAIKVMRAARLLRRRTYLLNPYACKFCLEWHFGHAE
jgi:hypothetical protein